MLRFLLLIFLLSAFNQAYADMIGYSDSLRIRLESKNLIVIHYHNWTDATRDARYKMISTDQDPFTAANRYAYIACFDRKTGKLIFKKPCPALTRIEISKDEKYILGISKIMLWNPYQLVVFSCKGELIKKRHIDSEEAKLTKTQFFDFKNKYPQQYSFLNFNNRIFVQKGFYFVGNFSMNMPSRLGKAWDYLSKYASKNHLSENFSETVTNWVYWFYETEPLIAFNYEKTELVSISLLDPKKGRVEIKINE